MRFDNTRKNDQVIYLLVNKNKLEKNNELKLNGNEKQVSIY